MGQSAEKHFGAYLEGTHQRGTGDHSVPMSLYARGRLDLVYTFACLFIIHGYGMESRAYDGVWGLGLRVQGKYGR